MRQSFQWLAELMQGWKGHQKKTKIYFNGVQILILLTLIKFNIYTEIIFASLSRILKPLLDLSFIS